MSAMDYPDPMAVELRATKAEKHRAQLACEQMGKRIADLEVAGAVLLDAVRGDGAVTIEQVNEAAAVLRPEIDARIDVLQSEIIAHARHVEEAQKSPDVNVRYNPDDMRRTIELLDKAALLNGEVMELPAIKALIAATEREYLCDDEPDDSDISHPPSGITMGMIRAARAECNAVEIKGRLLRRLNKGIG